MSHAKLLDIRKTALLVVDVQEAFRGVISDLEQIASRISVAVRGFQILGRPVFVTEQYPAGLGRTVSEINEVLPAGAVLIEKTAFSSCGATGFSDALREAGVSQVSICGIETHICVNQTVHDLIDLGFDVHLLTDCVGSRFDYDKQAGLSKMFASGAVASSVEMALFEMMRDAKHDKFKEIQRLVK
jgi:nicotinamidase-related amidase